MLRSKSRSGHLEFGQKKHSSSLIRSITSSKFCRGDSLESQVYKEALIPVNDHQNPPRLSENRIVKAAMMEKQIGNLEDELKNTKERLDAVAEERNQALSELSETKELANNATTKLNEARQVFSEVKVLKDSLNDSKKEFEAKLAEKDASLDELNRELRESKASEAHVTGLLSESEKRVRELEGEVAKSKQSETRMLESLIFQTKQLGQTKMELEESKLEIMTLHGQMDELQKRVNLGSVPVNARNSNGSIKESIEDTKENLDEAREGKKAALMDEIRSLKNELKLANEAEEKSKKAMDDLALALTEVATEASTAKEKLKLNEEEFEHMKNETEQLKEMIRTTEEQYQKQLDEMQKEIELHKNTAERLRLEAEESLLAWNGKEMGFVTCIRRAEEETALAKHENNRLNDTLVTAEASLRNAREETYKLRDILKQAINESNVAKGASNIARAENSELKDLLAEKEEALHFLTKENERLRIDEVAAHEKMELFKKLLAAQSDFPGPEDKEQGDVFKSPVSSLYDDCLDSKTATPLKTFSSDLDEDVNVGEIVVHEDPEKEEALKGSIFDTESPKSEPESPNPEVHHQRSSSVHTDPGTIPCGDLEQLNSSSNDSHVDDTDDRSFSRRRLFRRIGELIVRKSYG